MKLDSEPTGEGTVTMGPVEVTLVIATEVAAVPPLTLRKAADEVKLLEEMARVEAPFTVHREEPVVN